MHDERAQSSHRHPTLLQHRSLKWLPLLTSGAYFGVAVLWIVASDRLLPPFTQNTLVLNELHSLKDSLFVCITAGLLYGLLRQSLRTLHKANTDLVHSEERLRLILQNMPVMLDAFDAEGNLTLWNQECERVTGYGAAEMLGNPQAMALLYPDAAYRQQMLTAWTERGNNYRNWEWAMGCKDGSVKTVAWSNISDRFPIAGWAGWGIGVDVTDRKQTEASLRTRNTELLTLHKISEIMLQQQSLHAAFQDIVKEISAATGFPIIAIELYDATRQMMVFEGTEGIPLPPDGTPIEVPVSQTASKTVIQTGKMLVKTYSLHDSKPSDWEALRCQLELRTFICVPLTVNGTTIGTLSLGHPDVVQPEDDFLQWLTSLANYLALLTDRQRTERALRESEEFFKLALDFTHIGSWDWRVPINQAIWNENHARLLGLVPGTVQASYQVWRERVHPDDIDRVEEAITQALANQTNFEAEYRVVHPDGSLHWLFGRGRGIYDESGQVIRMIGAVLDTTDRKQAEQEIQQLNQALEQQNLSLEALVEQRTAELMTFINTLPDYIFVIDRQMRFLFCNEQNAHFIGFEARRQVEGKTIFELFLPDQAKAFAAQNQQVFASGELLHFQAAYDRPEGTLHLDTYKMPLKRPNGEVYALIGAARDVTELVEARQTLSDRTVQLEMTNRELESFSYSISHDLRAPLRHITGFVAALTEQLTQNGQLTDPAVVHYLQILRHSSQTMGQLIDGLLALSRLGRRQKAHIPVDLNQVVAAVIAQRPERTTAPHDGTDQNDGTDQTEETATSGQQVRFSVSELPMVMGDATLLQQVFANLVDNAVKFSRVRETSAKQKRHPALIEIGSLPDSIIFVRDYGVGFQMAYADQLFGAFQRLHSRSEFEGSGIGLAIVQRIIHRHGGQIWADSQPGQGATFYFKLGDYPSALKPTDYKVDLTPQLDEDVQQGAQPTPVRSLTTQSDRFNL